MTYQLDMTAMADRENSGQSAPLPPLLLDSATLFAGRNELVILHNGTPYRLRITRQDKLILTK